MRSILCVVVLALAAPCAQAGLTVEGPIPAGSGVTIAGHGAQPGAYVEIVANDVPLGCTRASEDGRFAHAASTTRDGDWVHARHALAWRFQDVTSVTDWSVENAALVLDGHVLTLRATGNGPVVLTTAAGKDLALRGDIHRVFEIALRNQSSARAMDIAWSFDGVGFDGPGQRATLPLAPREETITTRLFPLDHLKPLAGVPDSSTWDTGGPIARLRFTWDGCAADEAVIIDCIRFRSDVELNFDTASEASAVTGFHDLDSLGIRNGALCLRPTGPDPYFVLSENVAGLLDSGHFTRLTLAGYWETGVPESPVQAYWCDNNRGNGPDLYAKNGNFAETSFPLTTDTENYQRAVLPLAACDGATWNADESPVQLTGLRIDPMVYPNVAAVSPEDRIRLDVLRLCGEEDTGPSPVVVVGAPTTASSPDGTRPGGDQAIEPPHAPLAFTVDMAGRPGDHRVLRQVDTVATHRGWRDGELTEEDWALRRWEGVVIEMAGWFRLSSHDPSNSLHALDDTGRYVFKPMAGTKEVLDQHVLNGGLRPNIAMGTPTMPWPLVEGGFKAGEYGYQIRQPKDYEAWRFYLESLFQWLIDQYGRDEVKTWTYLFGIESDWQARAVYPGTQIDMGVEENRREFMKELDYFHAAATAKLGPTVYVGCYFAFETQADDYIRHWGEERNYATGEVGTRIGWCGFSDWYIVNMDRKNPFSRTGQARRRGNVGNTWAAGLVWKYEHMAELLNRCPTLRGVEIGLPECGFFDTAGAVNPKTGNACPADVAYADYRGATLRALRNIAYAACPRVAFAKNHHALGTGAGGLWTKDTAKAPVFNASRIQRDMAGDRPLRVEKTGREQQESDDVRLLATATDGPGLKHRLLLVNFNERFDGGVTEPVPIRLEHLPPVETIEVTECRVDADHNNWWEDWRAYREAEGIPYVAGVNHSHLGSNVRYHDRYAPWHNDVIGTLRAEDVPKWLAWADANADRMTLRATSAPASIPVVDGVAELRCDLPPQGTLLLELRYRDTAETLPIRLLTGPGGWDTVQKTVYAADGGKSGGPALKLYPHQGGARATRRVTGLSPDTAYTLGAWARASGRVMDYGVTAGEDMGWGDWSARWNRVVATARADGEGSLTIALDVPARTYDPEDHVTFSGVVLTRSGW